MKLDTSSLSHTRWNCKYHVVFAPKYRRQVIYGKIKADIGMMLRKLCEYKEIEIIDNTLIYHYGLSLIDYTLLPEARNEERWKELRKSLKSLEQKNNEEIPI